LRAGASFLRAGAFPGCAPAFPFRVPVLSPAVRRRFLFACRCFPRLCAAASLFARRRFPRLCGAASSFYMLPLRAAGRAFAQKKAFRGKAAERFFI